MSANPWSLAFKRAVEVEEEGAKDFVDIIAQHAQKKQKLVATVCGSDNPDKKEEYDNPLSRDVSDNGDNGNDEDVSSSGQGLLPQLSKFVMETTKAKLPSAKEDSDKVDVQGNMGANNATLERDMVEVCGRQMCRAWLKHTYLNIGSPCKDGEACLRKHGVTCKPEHLYKDYSFKGLSAKQRKIIMDKLKAESV